jgi:hypothetical protein
MDWYIELDKLTEGDIKRLESFPHVERNTLFELDPETVFGSYRGAIDFWWGGHSGEELETMEQVVDKLKERGVI